MKKNHRLNTILIIALTLGFGFTISAVNAGPPIAVTSADPDEAERDTTPNIKINGRGFDQSTNIQFCWSETNTDDFCDNGGVVVQPGSVKFINSKKLEVSVEVKVDADIGKFNIEAFSSGRRGRGIEKFAVLKVGGGASELLQASFDLTIVYTDQMAIESDGSPYQDNNKDHVQVSTGPVPGLRFDTNLQNDHRAGKFAKARLVYMSVTGLAMDKKPFEIDFRFDLPTGGLDLGSLAVPDNEGDCPACEGTVAAWIRYYAGGVVSEFDDQNWGKLGFGAIHADINEISTTAHAAARECLKPKNDPDSRKIRVTRTGADTWTLESNVDGVACRFALEGSGNGEAECAKVACEFNASDEIDFTFKFELVVQPE